MTNNNISSMSNVNSYSKALYELSDENEVLEQIEVQVSAIIKLISQNKDFNNLIKDPTSKKEDQLNIMKLISQKFNFNSLLTKFLSFLVIKRKLFFIEKILKDFLIICSNKRGEILAKITVAKDLNAEEIENVKNELSKNFGSNIKLTYKYDSTLIGGLIIQVGSIMVDTSLKNKLQQIENKMIEA